MNILKTERGLAIDCDLNLPRSLHARPAAKIAQKAREFKANILLISESGEADAKSMLDILSLAIQPESRLRLLANGEDAEAAIRAVLHIIQGENA